MSDQQKLCFSGLNNHLSTSIIVATTKQPQRVGSPGREVTVAARNIVRTAPRGVTWLFVRYSCRPWIIVLLLLQLLLEFDILAKLFFQRHGRAHTLTSLYARFPPPKSRQLREPATITSPVNQKRKVGGR